MTISHLSESEIQQYVLDRKNTGSDILAHIHDCERCQTKAAAYNVLFKELKEIPKPAFDFDLSKLVLDQLPVRKPLFPWMATAAACLAIFLISFAIICFTNYLSVAAIGLSAQLLYFLIIPAVFILVIQGLSLLKVHKKQMTAINFN
ncbi:hypothetical protein DBR43_23385 [Pedobacter sp. KBW06]|uniref:hypothetical protein n=1 Tax=Pedobacter sp. KBW06 TaxID=2153359 RepID=UPI000F592A49|nr:hypothetical protein [Pedobacter sp. KBW06]RQO67482.1 hypothetical protein DBR43_23385 [Pedobacter sp. KBW06]